MPQTRSPQGGTLPFDEGSIVRVPRAAVRDCVSKLRRKVGRLQRCRPRGGPGSRARAASRSLGRSAGARDLRKLGRPRDGLVIGERAPPRYHGMMTTINDPDRDGPLALRRAGPSDADAIRALTRAAYARWVPVLGREPKPMGADYRRAVREHRIDLVESEGELAALIELVAEPGALLIENVAVSPAHRGRGLGHRLLRHAETVAIAAGHPRMRLYTNRLMAANVALYESLGYVIDREEANAYGTVVHMSKPVPGS